MDQWYTGLGPAKRFNLHNAVGVLDPQPVSARFSDGRGQAASTGCPEPAIVGVEAGQLH